MKIFKKIGFVFDVLQVYDEVNSYLNSHHTTEKMKNAIEKIKTGIDELGSIFPDVIFLKEKFSTIFKEKA